MDQNGLSPIFQKSKFQNMMYQSLQQRNTILVEVPSTLMMSRYRIIDFEVLLISLTFDRFKVIQGAPGGVKASLADKIAFTCL